MLLFFAAGVMPQAPEPAQIRVTTRMVEVGVLTIRTADPYLASASSVVRDPRSGAMGSATVSLNRAK